jgi:hypothetical protein
MKTKNEPNYLTYQLNQNKSKMKNLFIAVNFSGDQHAADAFFSSVYQLKPIPERLA